MSKGEIASVLLTTILTSCTGAFVVYARKVLSRFAAIGTVQRLLVKDRIVQAHDYFSGKGSIGKYSLATLEELFTEYQKMGGNGFVRGLMEEIRELPIQS